MKDNKGVRFITTTVIGGLLFLIPVGFLGFVLFKVFGFMMIIAERMNCWQKGSWKTRPFSRSKMKVAKTKLQMSSQKLYSNVSMSFL